MLGWLRAYGALIGATLRARAVYRVSFVTDIVLQMALFLGELAAVLLIVQRVGGIGGWNTWDVMFLFGLATMSAGIYRVFASELHNFDRYLVDAEFDSVLLRPMPTYLAVVGRGIAPWQAGMSVQGLLVLLFASAHLPRVTWSSAAIGELIAGAACGAVIWLSLVTATAAIGFWTMRIEDIQPVLLYGPETASSYPMSIYPQAIRDVFFTIVPVACGSYVPAAILLHRGLGPPALLGSLAAAILSACAAALLWQAGVRHYTSSGS